MTVASATAKSGPYTGNGSQTVFAYGFKIFANTELQVIRTSVAGADTTLTLTTDYTVSGVGADAGGNVTCTTAPASGEKITILRNVALTQLTDLRQQGGFYPEVHERVFDRLAMAVQQVNEKADRSVKVSPSAATTPDALLASIATSEANAATSASSAATSAATASAAVLTVGVPSITPFTGNGSQTVFSPLAATPPSTNAIMVFVGGVHQERTKFSYVGTTLTFVTAPPNGAPIQVVIGAPLNSTSFTNTVGTAEIQNNAVTLAKIARVGTAGHILTSGGAGADPSYIGVLPVANGGTNYTGGAWTTATPTPTPGSGSFTTASATTRWLQIGKIVFFQVTVVITTVGTASGRVDVPLPVAPVAANAFYLAGMEVNSTGFMLKGLISTASGGTVQITNYDNTSAIGAGRSLNLSGVYEAA